MYFHLSDEYDPDADPADIAEEELSHAAEFIAKRVNTPYGDSLTIVGVADYNAAEPLTQEKPIWQLPAITKAQALLIQTQRRQWLFDQKKRRETAIIRPRAFGC